MKNLIITQYNPKDQVEVINLWQACGLIVPWNHPVYDIQRKYHHSAELFFVARKNEELVASCMAGYDGHRGSIYYLAVKPEYQRKSYATALVEHVETVLREQGCVKINLLVRKTNLDVVNFYRKIGYQDDPVVMMGKRLMKDDSHEY